MKEQHQTNVLVVTIDSTCHVTEGGVFHEVTYFDVNVVTLLRL